MIKKLFFSILGMFITLNVYATSDYAPYFKVDMNMELPNIEEYLKNSRKNNIYNRGYISRLDMGTKFKKEFSQTIKFYGQSESRIKNNYEDELLEIINWLPKETYQYIGPMLHEVPGMPEKILNLPGIKETKNQFPKDIAEEYVGMEGIEYLSPGLYFLLMPRMMQENVVDAPTPTRVKKPHFNIELPQSLKKKIGIPVKTSEKQKGSARVVQNLSIEQKLGYRTHNPTLTSLLTTKDVEAVISSFDDIINWGMQNNMENYVKLIQGEAILNFWENEQQSSLPQNDLKDAVNPCQRLVLKTRFANLYEEFAQVVAKNAFTPEGWAYTCDKTIKAFRITTADLNTAYAIRAHRRGYYDKYLTQLPQKWRDQMEMTEEAIIRMYTALKEDIDTVSPYKKELTKKFQKMRDVMLTEPIIY